MGVASSASAASTGGAAPGAVGNLEDQVSALREAAVRAVAAEIVTVPDDEFRSQPSGRRKLITWGVLQLKHVVECMHQISDAESWRIMRGPSVITSSLRNSHFGLDVQERFARAAGREWVIADLKGYRGL